MKSDSESLILMQLRSTLSKMELSLDAIDDEIIWIDKEGIIQWCNEKFNQLIKHPHILILGKSIFDLILLKKAGQTILLKDVLIKNLENKSRYWVNVYEFEKDDMTIFLEIYSNAFHETHEETSIIVVLRDVTEKQKTQKKIEFLASIPENNSAPILSVNKKN